MTKQHLDEAIEHCNQGNIQFSRGIVHSFQYAGKWYPIRSIVHYASELANERIDWNVYQCLYNLNLMIPYVRVADVEYLYPLPKILSNEEKIHEVRLPTNALDKLTQ